MPSVTAIVVNSRGVPPPALTPCLAQPARRFRCTLQGVASFQELPTAMMGLLMSSSVRPMARRGAVTGGPGRAYVWAGLKPCSYDVFGPAAPGRVRRLHPPGFHRDPGSLGAERRVLLPFTA